MTDYRRAWLGDTWLFAINLLHRRGNDLTRNRIVARRRDWGPSSPSLPYPWLGRCETICIAYVRRSH